MSRVIVEIGKHRYRVIKDGECSKRGCSLYDADICEVDCEALMHKAFPCEKIMDAFYANGLCVSRRSSYKEVK